MKRQTKTYFRTLYISLVIIMCLCFGWIGISTAYESTVQIATGEYKDALEITDNTIRILDFIIKK
ncbi:MAG: hypothetical protein IJN56_05550 [Clostridia bacterium]|nr:hypothetical protein [Clostridia bacterium]